MIKGITGYGYFDELCIPIIENTAWEHELADSLGEAIEKNPKSVAILVRRHGMYVWGKTWEEAKRHGECLHYLFEVAIQMKKLSMDFLSAPLPLKSVENQNNNKKRSRETGDSENKLIGGLKKNVKYVLFDIEGTTTPLSFVKNVLFPYSIKKMEKYLEENWDKKETQADMLLLLPTYGQTNKESIKEISKYLIDCIKNDSKISTLKNIQGRIWDQGYSEGELKSIIYDDVLDFFTKAQNEDVKVAIYSSGSRNAQKLLFKYSNLGDIRKYISCYFDTSVGQKQEKKSYEEIIQSLGVDNGNEILFVTDILGESQAAIEAGMLSVLAVRAENAPLPSGHGLETVTTFHDLLN